MTDSALRARITNALGPSVLRLRPLTGGCIGEVYRADLEDGTVAVVKVDNGDEPRLDIEALMLRYLCEYSQLPVPQVYLGDADLLIMEFIENDGRPGRNAELQAADALAALHGIGAEEYGFHCDTLIGGLPLPNHKTQDWPRFFADHRIRDMATRAVDTGMLDDATSHRIDDLCDNIDDVLDNPQPPSLIHGDIWSGNVLYHGGQLAGFIDPATYYADPEIELAFIDLFHTFGDRFYDRYREHRRILPGFFELRKDVYNLYPLLVHTRLFGGSYMRSVQNTLQRLGF